MVYWVPVAKCMCYAPFPLAVAILAGQASGMSDHRARWPHRRWWASEAEPSVGMLAALAIIALVGLFAVATSILDAFF